MPNTRQAYAFGPALDHLAHSRVAGQKEMLMPIVDKKQAKETAGKRPAAKSQRRSA